VKEIRHSGGKPAVVPEIVRTPIVSSEAARGLRKMLREVVVKGTAKRAQLNGYTSAGKTGTAWKYNAKLRRVDAGKYVSSFIGMAPAENPAVVILVVMDEPQGGARDGGQVSAPVFREIAEQILPEMNIAPDASVVQEDLTDEVIPSEIEAVELQAEAENLLEEQNDKTPKKMSEKSAVGENVKKETLKEVKKIEKPVAVETRKTAKQENKPSDENKPSIKQKAPIVAPDAKNKSSTEKVKKKT
jgi:membrane peptidoglycan carboxypeptidase